MTTYRSESMQRSAQPPYPPPRGFVYLILLPAVHLYLEIPIDIIRSCCLRPLKYLQYIGWCVLGVIGNLTDEEGNAVSVDDSIINQGVYHYNVNEGLIHAIDPEVIERQSEMATTTATRERFREKLLERDGYCVWTSIERPAAIHIIPFVRGDKTPNDILVCEDIPERYRSSDLEDNISFPVDSRYTLQWLVPHLKSTNNHVPHNSDATFLNHKLPKPSSLLLHYNYGAAALKHWGRNTNILRTRDDLPRPAISENVPTGPTRTMDYRSRVNEKLNRRPKNEDGDGDGGFSVAGMNDLLEGRGESYMEESEEPKTWTEDDAMLVLWASTKVAQERRAKKEEEYKERMESWRSGVIS